MLKRLLALAWMILVIVAIGCKGPEGPEGPKGDKGDTGATGATGPAGKDGEGSSSGALIFGLGADTTDTDGYLSPLVLEDLTADEIEAWDSAVILIYLKSGGAYWPLPGLVPFSGANSEFTFYHGIDGSTFFANIFQINWSGRASASEKPPVRIVQDVRLIVIPGQKVSRLNGTVNFKNYEETIKALGLSDGDAKQISRTFSKVRRR